jgi:hypothetical protein
VAFAWVDTALRFALLATMSSLRVEESGRAIVSHPLAPAEAVKVSASATCGNLSQKVSRFLRLTIYAVFYLRPQFFCLYSKNFRQSKNRSFLRAAIALKHHGNGRLTDSQLGSQLRLREAFFRHEIAKAIGKDGLFLVHLR